MKQQQGFSLVELMVAITVGLILMGGVVQMFVSSKTVFSTQEGISRVQETGRLGIEFLAGEIREAGYMGCLSRGVTNVTSVLNDHGDVLFDFDNGIEAYAKQADAGLDLVPAPVKDTPIIILRGANRSGVSITKNNNGGQFFATNFGPTGDGCWSDICTEDVLLVTDCAKARIFQATNVTGTKGDSEMNIVHSTAGGKGNGNSDKMYPGNAFSNWGPGNGNGNNSNPEERFDAGAEVIKLQSVVFYIANSGDAENPKYGLWQKVAAAPAFELLEGVENMYLEFAVDNDGDSLVDDGDFVTLVEVGDWKEVVAVRVNLLVRSTDDNVAPENQKYTFAGKEVTADDRRIRQVFTSTVGIRSRLN